MARIRYQARNLSGEVIQGTLHAEDERAARDLLSEKGLDVLSVHIDASAGAAGTSAARLASRSLFRPVKTRSLASVTGQLALMLRTGTSLLEALQALAEQTAEERLAEVLTSVATDVSGGSTLANALAAHPSVFDELYVSAVRSGEASGRLAEVFQQLESYLQKRVELRGGLLTALIYPAVVSVLAVVAVIFVVAFVLPRFVDIFVRSNVLLPLPTRALMAMSEFTLAYWHVLVASFAALVTSAVLYARSPKGSVMVDRLVLALPVLGPLANMVNSSMLLRTIGTLSEAGLPLVETLDVAGDGCKNRMFKAFVGDVRSGIIRGESLSDCFAGSDLMSPTIKQMVSTGERTGSLPLVLKSVADHLEAAADKQVKRLSAVFEPAVIVAMGLAIGFIAVAVLLPLFRLTSAARGGA